MPRFYFDLVGCDVNSGTSKAWCLPTRERPRGTPKLPLKTSSGKRGSSESLSHRTHAIRGLQRQPRTRGHGAG
jgi:hypothetical protein